MGISSMYSPPYRRWISNDSSATLSMEGASCFVAVVGADLPASSSTGFSSCGLAGVVVDWLAGRWYTWPVDGRHLRAASAAGKAFAMAEDIVI